MAQSPDNTATEIKAERSPPPNTLKRSQSEVSEQENKRRRTSPGKTPPAPDSEDKMRRASTDRKPEPARARKQVDEKDRTRRLFGGLMGNLSQKPDNRTNQRRQEIEARKKAELQRQDEEHAEDKQRRLEELAEKRKRVQKQMEEDMMRNRHRDMLARANFLQTEAHPRIFYKPWELLPEQEDQIEDQIAQVKAKIDRELSERQVASTADGGGDDGDTMLSKEDQTRSHTTDPHTMSAATPRETAATATSSAVTAQLNHAPDANETQTAAAPTVDYTHDPEIMEHDKTDPDKEAGASASQLEVGDTEESAAKETLAQEQDDHVVEGEEDTVIY